MDIQIFPIKLAREEAETMARQKGGLFWRTVFSRKDLSELRQHFVEYKVITLEAVFRPTIIQRLLFRKTDIRKQKIQMLANGSTGSVSWIESMPEIVTMNGVDENAIQLSDRNDDRLVSRCRKVAVRVMHRFAGGIPELEVLSIESVYRPFWIALYGNTSANNKCRYLPIAADLCGSHRSF